MIYNKTLFEISKDERIGCNLPNQEIDEKPLEELLPQELIRSTDLKLPQISEIDVVRHYTLLSNKNYGVDTGFYPLGSCTMKYNPKINEDLASDKNFTELHPNQPTDTVQGSMEIMYNLNKQLSEITGMDKFTLQPAAGAHGELAGLMIIKAYHMNKGNHHKTKIIIPDSAHGTNPASAVIAGFEIIEIKSNNDGSVNINELKEKVDDNIAGLMLTNPSTLGLFEKEIKQISEIIHQKDGLLYYDGANMNAIMGIAKPGDMGFDILHLNLHKTFATPHGGGGPGSGPVGVKNSLIKYLPVPIVEKNEGKYFFNYDYPHSIGKIKNFYGNFNVMIKAYSYICTMGYQGLKKASQIAVLNANYMMQKLKKYYTLPIDETCMHEFVLSGPDGEVTTLDIAKRLLDYGFHPPTIYFPLIIKNSIMIEPTETESKENIDSFIDAMIKISEEIKTQPSLLQNAPYKSPIKRLNEVKAARQPILKWEYTK